MNRTAAHFGMLACLALFCAAAAAQDEIKALKGMRFSYSPAQGLGFEEGITRRDPSDVIEVNGIYYVWYTKTSKGSSGYDATVWYATSEDGHAWTEQKEALGRGPEGGFDERSVFTPNILVAEGQYWLFYTAVANPFDEQTKTAIGLAVSKSPDGPFRRVVGNPVLETGEPGTWTAPAPRTSAEPKGAWDSHRVDDACLIMRDRTYRLYFKGRQMGLMPGQTQMGLAVADRPQGPYVKHVSNPIVNSGHEVLVWPCGTGVASLASRGPASFWTSEDGIRFALKDEVKDRPMAPGAFRPQAFTDQRPAENFCWGISMIHHKKWPYLVRFEMHLPRVLIIGDSISMGYTPYVKKALAGVAEVRRNPGNAEHSGFGVKMLEQWLGDVNWEVIHFNHGLHDLKYVDDQGKIVKTESEGHVQVPIEAYKENLDAIVARLKKTKAHIFFATTTPYPDKVSGPLRKPGYAEKYNEAALEVMRRHGITVNNLHGHVATHLEQYQQPNNVHFKKEGSAFLGEKVAEAVSMVLDRAPLTDDALKAARDKARFRTRRIIMNNDGNDNPADPVTPQSFLDMRTTPLLASHVDSVFYCTGVNNLYSHRSEVSEQMGVNWRIENKEWVNKLTKQDTDSLSLMIQWCRDHGKEIFWSMRMNDRHDSSAKLRYLLCQWKRDHPELLMGKLGDRWPYGGNSWSALRYGRAEVRERMYRILEDVCTRYDVDGVELDFFRHPVYFIETMEGKPVPREKMDAMTALWRRVRAMADRVGCERGRPLLIAIRIPDSLDYCLAMGLDVKQWLEEGLIDLVTGGGYFKLEPWENLVALGKKYNVPVYAAFVRRRIEKNAPEPEGPTALEVWRGEAYMAWKAGVNGIYTFNRFDPRDPLFRELGDPELLATLDKVDRTAYDEHCTWSKPQTWVNDGNRYVERPLSDKATKEK